MNMRVAAGADGRLVLFSEADDIVATLSAQAVALLVRLARIGTLNPIAAEHMQRIVRQLPAERQETTRLGLTAAADTGDLLVTAAGLRLLKWLEQEWKGWSRYTRVLPRYVHHAWGWQVIATS